MKIIRLEVGEIGTNCYLLCDEAARLAAVIDPGGDSERILDALRETGCSAQMILLTHGHFDHTGAVAAVAMATGAKIYAHEEELRLLLSPAASMQSSFMGGPFTPIVPDAALHDEDTLTLGTLTMSILYTPGHTHGSCCILCGSVLFTGDTVFQSDIGRTDLPTASRTEMKASVTRIAALEGDYTLYPGHGPASTLANERENNVYMR
ncbi:MAG: MBL fold metallo-hydrolase [Clostridia bacterium]|nr:MBL fold metallo-hydrolase [Clostridia bacterium]